jgi:hypothetical protein
VWRTGREKLTINGETTVEHDYTALHIRLLYQEAEKAWPGDDYDPYDLADWPRNQVKLAMLIAINAPTETTAIRAIAIHVFGTPYRAETAKARALLRAVKAKHVDIAHAFGSDAGARLMRKDSDITEQVMMDMIRQGVVPLSIHDSYIVPANQGERLREAMDRELKRNDVVFHDNVSLMGTKWRSGWAGWDSLRGGGSVRSRGGGGVGFGEGVAGSECRATWSEDRC